MSAISSRNNVPPSASSNLPFFASVAPVKDPFVCPKSSLSISSSGIAAQVDLHKGGIGPGAHEMDVPADKFLAGSAFTVNQNPAVRRRHHCYLFSQRLYRNTVADDVEPRFELVPK
jgi:hypothetical protein